MKRNGCHNRPPLGSAAPVLAQDGWINVRPGERFSRASRIPIMKEVPFRMSTECVYSKEFGQDPKCAGCRWNQQEQTDAAGATA